MRRREFIALVGGGVAASTLGARAEQPNRIWRVGMLHVVPDQASLGFTAFRKKLAEFGYVEGQNIVFEYRWSDQMQRLPAFAAELRDLKMDVIVTADATATLVAKQATKDIPIVAAVFTEDPVAAGLVESLRRPGGNVTGISILAPEMSGKRLELLREIVPGLARVAVLWSRQVPYHVALLHETDEAARALGIAAVPIESSEDIEDAFRRIIKEHVGAVDVLQSAQFARIRAEIAELGLKYQLPTIAGSDSFCAAWRINQIWPECIRQFSSSSSLRRQDLKRSETGRLAGIAADPVRAGDQP